ncbi:MAG: non-homologous end-joining DNA ligase [Actinomycetota bacterium]|nr:non-homologous end-joining DNA ligase [Actinomycetota bacterium]
MRQLRFGIAGLKDPDDLEGSVKELTANGFTACEVQFVREFTLKEGEAKQLGELARDSGITLSVHAPYFAQLTTKEPDRLKLHLGGLHHACKLAAGMGAGVVVCHPGSRHEASPEELHERVDAALTQLGPRIEDLGVKLGLETCGRRSQFGSLGDLALLVRKHPFTTVVVDYAHIHALSNGSLTSAEAFEALFAYITEEFSFEHFWPLHTHFSDNEYGPGGEIRHVPYGDGSLRIRNVVEGARRFDLALTVISEEKDPESHRAILSELQESQAPLASLAPRAEAAMGGRPWFPAPVPLERRGEGHVFRRGFREVRITNIQKVLFPEDGLTKGDLISYYYNVAPLMLPFLKDRLINMQRVPDGIYGEAFYEKQAPRGAPPWLRTVPVPSDGGTRIIDYIIVDDVATLVWLAQIACVECHAWTSRWPNLDQPDYAVLDLDPHEPIEFADVRTVARLVGVVLDGLGLKGFPKTSGGSGIQIFVPLAEGHTYKEVRAFCSAVGGLVRSAYPEKVTLEASKSKRAGKVYVDAGQNAKGQTLVAPYSVRPYPGAPVSTPLAWEELDEDFYPEQFLISTIFERLEKVGNLFSPAVTMKQDLKPALRRFDIEVK